MVSFRTVATSALLVVPAVLADPFTSPSGLYARQISGFDPSTIPSTCIQQQCQAFDNEITTTASGCSAAGPTCLCTNDIVNSLKSCVQCAVNSGADGYNQTTADEVVSNFVNTCNSAGHPVSASGSGGSGGSVSSSSGSPAATGSSGSPAATATGASTTTGGTTTKSGAVVGMSISLVGSILALALGAINFA